MKIEATKARRFQYGLRQDEAVSDNDRRVEVKRAESGAIVIRFKVAWRTDFQPVRLGECMHWRNA